MENKFGKNLQKAGSFIRKAKASMSTWSGRAPFVPGRAPLIRGGLLRRRAFIVRRDRSAASGSRSSKASRNFSSEVPLVTYIEDIVLRETSFRCCAALGWDVEGRSNHVLQRRVKLAPRET